MQFTVQRTDPAFKAITAIYQATGSFVSVVGNGVEVGQIVIQYSGAVDGPVPAVVGQTILTNASCGPYSNDVYTITNAFTYLGNNFIVIDAPGLGEYDPAPSGAEFRVWLDEYVWLAKLLVYTDPEGAPSVVPLGPYYPNEAGVSTIDVSGTLQRFFDIRIDRFMDGPGSGLTANAHGLTALFYRVHIVESYNSTDGVPPLDPYNGSFDVLEDDTESNGSFRVGVNAVHPYGDWATAGMGGYVVGGSSFQRKFLTHAPRGPVAATTGVRLTMGSGDRYCAHMLTPGTSQAGNDAWEVGYKLIVREVVNGTPGTILLDVPIALTGITSAFAVSVGPADLSPYMTLPAVYVAYIQDDGASASMSEPILITIDDKCGESDRRFTWLNTLGGTDHYTFRGRELENTSIDVATVRKPYYGGTGYDYTERMLRVDSTQVRTISSRPVKTDIREWIAGQLFRSAHVVTKEGGRVCGVILESGQLHTASTGPDYKPVTINYRLGVDQFTQGT